MVSHKNPNEAIASPPSETLIELFPNFTIPDQSLIDQYSNAFIVAFNEVYIGQNQKYMPYLTSGYTNYISGKINPIYFVPHSAEVRLMSCLDGFPSQAARGQTAFDFSSPTIIFP